MDRIENLAGYIENEHTRINRVHNGCRVDADLLQLQGLDAGNAVSFRSGRGSPDTGGARVDAGNSFDARARRSV